MYGGARPDSPYAARSRSWFTNGYFQKGSSLITQLALAFGYHTRLKFALNVLC